MNAESIVIGGGFFVIGISVGFLAMLILRMAIHARKFQFAGCLAVVTTLSGGGFLSYLTKPIHFGLYAIGFFFWLCRISFLPAQSVERAWQHFGYWRHDEEKTRSQSAAYRFAR